MKLQLIFIYIYGAAFIFNVFVVDATTTDVCELEGATRCGFQRYCCCFYNVGREPNYLMPMKEDDDDAAASASSGLIYCSDGNMVRSFLLNTAHYDGCYCC